MSEKIHIPDNAIVLLLGVAGSGKSTLAKKAFGENALVVSSDECRKEISGSESDQTVTQKAFELFYRKIDKGVKEGKQVIADATNLNKFSRERIYEIAKDNNVPVYALVFNIPLDVIKKQNANRKRVVPEYAILRMFHEMQFAYNEIGQELPKGHVIDIVTMENSKKEEEER